MSALGGAKSLLGGSSGNPEVIPKRLQKKNTQIQSTSFWPYLLQQFEIGGTDGIRTRDLLRDRQVLDWELCKLLKRLVDVAGLEPALPPACKAGWGKH